MDYIVVCHDRAHSDTSPAFSRDPSVRWTAEHPRSTSTLIGTPEFGRLWHCPEHADCKTCPDDRPAKARA
jgi:hypothetical protein